MKIPHSTALRSSLPASICNASTALFSLTKHSRRVPSDGIMVGTSQGLTVKRAMTMGLICLGMLAVKSEAAITFSNPVRSVSASNNKGSSQEMISNELGQFTESARVDWVDYIDYVDGQGNTQPLTSQYGAYATQDSMIGLTGISAKGDVVGIGDWAPRNDSYHQYSSSYFKVDVTIDITSNLYLKGYIEIIFDTEPYYWVFPEMYITLSSANGNVYSRNYFEHLEYYQAYVINEEFISLDPGDYVFEMSVRSIADVDAEPDSELYIVGYASTGYEITLVPEPSALLLAGLGVLLLRRKR